MPPGAGAAPGQLPPPLAAVNNNKLNIYQPLLLTIFLFLAPQAPSAAAPAVVHSSAPPPPPLHYSGQRPGHHHQGPGWLATTVNFALSGRQIVSWPPLAAVRLLPPFCCATIPAGLLLAAAAAAAASYSLYFRLALLPTAAPAPGQALQAPLLLSNSRSAIPLLFPAAISGAVCRLFAAINSRLQLAAAASYRCAAQAGTSINCCCPTTAAAAIAAGRQPPPPSILHF